MKQLVMTYPDDLAATVRLTDEEFGAQVRLMAALKMFELGKLSSCKAAELAGLSRVDFLEMCGRYQVPVFNYPDDEIASELAQDVDAVAEASP